MEYTTGGQPWERKKHSLIPCSGWLEPDSGFVCFLLIMADVLNHLPARLGTIAARLGALLHVIVVLEVFARFGAGVTRLGTRLASGHGHWTVAGDHFRCRRAKVGTVGTGAERLEVVLLAVGNQESAMVRARFALAHAIGACLPASSSSSVWPG